MPLCESLFMTCGNRKKGAVILLGRTNMFRFNHPKEAAKLREKRKSGLLSSFSLSMTDLSKSCENLSAVMLYNPGLEFERQQREELEKLEHKRKMIKEMEEKQRSEKAELEKMQMEVESQRKETEIVQLHIRKQEESLKRRSLDIEIRLKDLLAEKEKFEEERMREQTEIERQKRKQEEESFAKVQQELERLHELHSTEKAEKMEIFKELEKLKKEKDEQYMKLEMEKRRLEEQEREQLKIVIRLEEQLREKQEMIQLLKRGDFLRLEEEIQVLEDVREDLLRAKEARSEGEEDPDEVEKATTKYTEFKKMQVEQLSNLMGNLNQQKDCLEMEIIADLDILGRLNLINGDNCSLASTPLMDDVDMLKQTEHRLHCKERQLQYIKQNQLPALLEEKQRASEILDSDLLGLDKTLYQIEKEIEEKADQLAQFRASSDQLQQLQETFEFTANIARQEEKVRKKEKEILESREKQQREALEQAVAKLERRHSALQRQSTIDVEIEEQKRKLAAMDNTQEQAGLQASLEAEQKALEQDRERLSQEIQQLKQKIHVTDPLSKSLSGSQDEKSFLATSPASPVKSQPHFIQLTDDRIHAYIEEEVQRRLQNINLPSEDLSSLSLSYSPETGKGKDNLLNSITQRKMKYEKVQHPQTSHGKTSIPEIEYTTSSPMRQAGTAVSEQLNLNPVTANLYSNYSRKCSYSQEDHLTEENEEEKNRSSFSEYFDLLSDTEREPSHLLSRNLCNREGSHQNISSAALQNPAKTKGKHSESVSGDHDFSHIETDCTFFQQMSSSEMKTLDNELPKCKDIFPCNLRETNMLLEDKLKESKLCCRTHQGIHRKPCALQQVCNANNDSFACREATHHTYNLQSVFSKVSHLYKETQLPTIQNVIKQAKDFYNTDFTWQVPALSFIKSSPLRKYFPFTESNKDLAEPHSHDEKVKVYNIGQRDIKCKEDKQLVLQELYLRKGSEESKDIIGGAVSLVSYTFLNLPKEYLNLTEYSADDLLDYFSSVLPGFHADKKYFKGLYWHSILSKHNQEPHPACLLMFSSDLIFILLSHYSPVLLCSVTLTSLQELHISFGGQSVHLLGTFVDSPLAIFTFDSHCTQRLCQDIGKLLMAESSYTKLIDHALLSRDLMELSTDWNAAVSDVVCANGFRLTCNFKNALADTVYVLHENINGTKPPLGDVHLLLYTAVKVEHMQSVYSWLALTNTSIALVHDQALHPGLWDNTSSTSTSHQINLRSLSEIRCVIVNDRDDLTKMTIVFCKKESDLNVSTDEEDLLPIISQIESEHSLSEVWRLTFSSYKYALSFIKHLTH
ncbi:kinesin-like protein KIF16B isoform X3 [Hyperolius riggenbachi]|uniref:kinesin-like protein KIF16B isoform X3 n=1 Tax=Hyperolius riggenbachi TaxID=752182 RepID=UPI0035A330C0